MPPDGRRVDGAAIPEDGDNLAQDFVGLERAIFAGKSVTASDEAIAASSDEPVSDETVFAVAEQNLAREQVRGGAPAHCESVTRP